MKHPDPNATIQLDRVDRLDDVQLDDLEPSAHPAATNAGSPGRMNSNGPTGRPLMSSGPPPLPPGASLPPSTTYAPLPARNAEPRVHAKPASKKKTVVQAVLFVALLGAAVVGGLKMGASFRAPAPAPASPATVAAPTALETPPTPSASAAAPSSAPAVLTMPTIEMSDPPAESK